MKFKWSVASEECVSAASKLTSHQACLPAWMVWRLVEGEGWKRYGDEGEMVESYRKGGGRGQQCRWSVFTESVDQSGNSRFIKMYLALMVITAALVSSLFLCSTTVVQNRQGTDKGRSLEPSTPKEPLYIILPLKDLSRAYTPYTAA